MNISNHWVVKVGGNWQSASAPPRSKLQWKVGNHKGKEPKSKRKKEKKGAPSLLLPDLCEVSEVNLTYKIKEPFHYLG